MNGPAAERYRQAYRDPPERQLRRDDQHRSGELLRSTQRAGAVHPNVRTRDLLTLVSAISLATEQGDGGERAARLPTIAIYGLLT
ncbi:hypothetical protein AB0C96_42230 [Streptomyces sp. NPDC048506]|uniref:SbtR family transcriptional regulator n=1 Tax=Streptomyces sp. NPDC048506 TaxID=3155028 RepID=UPI0034341A3A